MGSPRRVFVLVLSFVVKLESVTLYDLQCMVIIYLEFVGLLDCRIRLATYVKKERDDHGPEESDGM